ncbi:MAG: hypothetical protein QW727_04400 [Candidatus Pacearchaeota archaeon]
MNINDLIKKVDTTISMLDGMNYKVAEYVQNDDEILLRANKLCDLLSKNGKIAESQKEDILEKLLNHKEALELFYSNEKIAGYSNSLVSDNFGGLIANGSNEKRAGWNSNKDDDATKEFIRELF